MREAWSGPWTSPASVQSAVTPSISPHRAVMANTLGGTRCARAAILRHPAHVAPLVPAHAAAAVTTGRAQGHRQPAGVRVELAPGGHDLGQSRRRTSHRLVDGVCGDVVEREVVRSDPEWWDPAPPRHGRE